MHLPFSRIHAWLAGAALLMLAIFATAVLQLERDLGARVRRSLIERDAAVLHPVAERELAQRQAELSSGSETSELLGVVLRTADQQGMLAVSAFDADGGVLFAAPDSLLVADLRYADYSELLKGKPITRYHPALPLDRYFADAVPGATAPVQEILLPLHDAKGDLAGFAQYHLDGHPLATELAATMGRVRRQTAWTLAIGGSLILLVLGGTGVALTKAERTIRERNDRLIRANRELTLAAKASAIGQITAHLLHGLQGSVAGLQAAVSSRESDRALPDWAEANVYTQRIQAMIAGTLELLGDHSQPLGYEISGYELLSLIRRRHDADARQRGVHLRATGGFGDTLDSYRGSLLCLIAANLIDNALMASPPNSEVHVSLLRNGTAITLTIEDAGSGLPEHVQAHLFEPGFSGRNGGTGLGLAISRLIARQLGAELHLNHTGPSGTRFSLHLPTLSARPVQAEPTAVSG